MYKILCSIFMERFLQMSCQSAKTHKCDIDLGSVDETKQVSCVTFHDVTFVLNSESYSRVCAQMHRNSK